MKKKDKFDYSKWAVAHHLWNVFFPDTRKKVITNTVKFLKPHLNEFDAVAFSGLSGALIVPSICDRIKKPMIVVRKPHDDTHSCLIVEGIKKIKRYIIIDDFIDSGKTYSRITYEINQVIPKAKCLGMLQTHELVNIPESHLNSYASKRLSRIHKTDSVFSKDNNGYVYDPNEDGIDTKNDE